MMALSKYESAEQMERNIDNAAPIIGENGNWWRWNAELDDFEDTGIKADQSSEIEAVQNGLNAHETDAIKHVAADERIAWNEVAHKVDKVDGKQLSTEDYTSQEKSKLDGIAVGADANVQSDWGESDATSDAYIKNKPESLLPVGGTEGQVLTKATDTDFDATWKDSQGGGGAGDAEPIGCMKFFAGEALPDGYLWCDGASYPTNGVYKKLFDVVGTRYNGSGDAAGTFRVPDMRGRVGVGKNDGTFGVLGGKGGEEKVKLTIAEMPAHGHTAATYFTGDGNGTKIASSQGVNIVNGNTDIKSAGGGQSHENMPPYLVCNYIIKFDRSYEQIGVTAPPVIWEIKPEDWQIHAPGGYVLNIPESEHRRGEHCVLTALYDTTEVGKLKAVLFEMEKNAAGDITIYSDAAFAGKAYIDRVYMVPAGRILTVNGQGPDTDGDVKVAQIESGSNENGNYTKFPDGTLICTKKIEIASLPVSFKVALDGTASIYITQPQSIGGFAASFFDEEYSVVKADVERDAIGNIYTWSDTIRTPTAYAWRVFANQSTTLTNCVCILTAIGRWK